MASQMQYFFAKVTGKILAMAQQYLDYFKSPSPKKKKKDCNEVKVEVLYVKTIL